MRPSRRTILSVTTAAPFLNAAPAPTPATPTSRQLSWHQLELDAFLYFTINTFTDK